MNNKFILGGGISGLIWALYNKDFKIISPEIGGQINSSFQLGTRYLEKNKYTKMFLKDIGVKIKERTIKVGYYDCCNFVTPDKDFRKRFIIASRGRSTNDNTAMNNDKRTLKIYEVDFLELVDKLCKKLKKRIILDRIEKIDKENIYLKSGKILKYEKIISTIPLNIFYKISGIKKELFSEDLTFVLLKDDFFNMFDFGFVYVLGNPYYRISETPDGLVAELLGSKTKKECKKIFRNYLIGCETVKNLQIISLKKKPKFKNVIFSGRYGAWDRSYKIEKVVEEAIKYGC